jgi:hypothetical protein
LREIVRHGGSTPTWKRDRECIALQCLFQQLSAYAQEVKEEGLSTGKVAVSTAGSAQSAQTQPLRQEDIVTWNRIAADFGELYKGETAMKAFHNGIDRHWRFLGSCAGGEDHFCSLSGEAAMMTGHYDEDYAVVHFLDLVKYYLGTRNSQNLNSIGETVTAAGKKPRRGKRFEILHVAKAASDYCQERARLTRKQLQASAQPATGGLRAQLHAPAETNAQQPAGTAADGVPGSPLAPPRASGGMSDRGAAHSLPPRPVRRSAKYDAIDRALREIAKAYPGSHKEVFRLPDGRSPTANSEPFESAGGWLAGFQRDRIAARSWLSKRWSGLQLPPFRRGPR